MSDSERRNDLPLEQQERISRKTITNRKNRICLWNLQKPPESAAGFCIGTPIEILRMGRRIEITIGTKASKRKVARSLNHEKVLAVIDLKGDIVTGIGDTVTVDFYPGRIVISPDGHPGSDILWESTERMLEEEGYFDPNTRLDTRKRRLREVIQRRGQREFRQKLLSAYENRCAITGCDAVSALEAAHIVPYQGSHTNLVTNGVLLRADIHTLFDLDLIGINPESKEVFLAERLQSTSYQGLAGQKLSLPSDTDAWPTRSALEIRWQDFSGGSPHG